MRLVKPLLRARTVAWAPYHPWQVTYPFYCLTTVSHLIAYHKTILIPYYVFKTLYTRSYCRSHIHHDQLRICFRLCSYLQAYFPNKGLLGSILTGVLLSKFEGLPKMNCYLHQSILESQCVNSSPLVVRCWCYAFRRLQFFRCVWLLGGWVRFSVFSRYC